MLLPGSSQYCQKLQMDAHMVPPASRSGLYLEPCDTKWSLFGDILEKVEPLIFDDSCGNLTHSGLPGPPETIIFAASIPPNGYPVSVHH